MSAEIRHEIQPIDADLLDVSLTVHIDTGGGPDVLRRFWAEFHIDLDSGSASKIGTMTGWIGWKVLDEDVADAADAISADSAYIGYVASKLLHEDHGDDVWIEDILLLDRISIVEAHRGQGWLNHMFKQLIHVLRFDLEGCILVTEPEPQQSSGGPYPDGSRRDLAKAGLLRSFAATGFVPWEHDDRVWWQIITPWKAPIPA